MSKLINHILIGGSSGDESRRMIGWGDPTQPGYWDRIIAQHVEPLLALGVTRHLLHNPFGTLRGEAMQFDQAIHARYGVKGKHEPLPHLLNAFVPAWRPVVDRLRDLGGEVIFYTGKALDDPDQLAIDDRVDNVESLFYRWHQCLWHADNAEMSVAFDAAHAVQAASDPTTWHLVETARAQLEKQNHRAYLEPRPHKDNPALGQWNAISTYDFWRRSDPERHADSAKWAMPNDAIQGEVVLLMASAHARYVGNHEAFAADCYAAGGTPALSLFYTLRDHGGPDVVRRMVEASQ